MSVYAVLLYIKSVFKGEKIKAMNQKRTSEKEYYVIDIAHIAKSVWRRLWVVIVSGFLTAAIAFSIAAFAIQPTYSSSIMLYVNNSSFTVGDIGFSISSSEITAAQSLVKTYTVLLKNRTTLEKIISTTKVDYTWEELYEMIEAEPVNETEIMQVTVTATDPYEAEKIANGIAVVLPKRVSEIVEGSSMAVVDSAKANTEKVAPSQTTYTLIGFILGVLVSLLVLIVLAMLDNTIHDEEFILNNFGYPILAKVPDLMNAGSKKYGYYS